MKEYLPRTGLDYQKRTNGHWCSRRKHMILRSKGVWESFL